MEASHRSAPRRDLSQRLLPTQGMSSEAPTRPASSAAFHLNKDFNWPTGIWRTTTASGLSRARGCIQSRAPEPGPHGKWHRSPRQLPQPRSPPSYLTAAASSPRLPELRLHPTPTPTDSPEYESNRGLADEELGTDYSRLRDPKRPPMASPGSGGRQGRPRMKKLGGRQLVKKLLAVRRLWWFWGCESAQTQLQRGEEPSASHPIESCGPSSTA
eukprot:jgi/Botrbrau1/15506/Bobra.43_2s0123.1